MLKSMTIRSTLAAVACAISFSAYAVADQPKQVNIPAGDLIPALEVLEKQTAIELVFQPDQLKSFHTKGVTGSYEPKDAVRILLKGTPLELRTDPTGAMVIAPPGAAVSRGQMQMQAAGDSGKVDDSRSGLQLAQVDQGASGSTPEVETGGEQASNKKPAQLEEILVTAQKRTERVQDVPESISVVTADDISDRGLVSAEDYLRGMPGVNQTDSGFGTSIVIRGLETTTIFQNFGQGTGVASYFGETPTTNSAGITGGASVDAKLVDIERVEVLRGPQGTEFGDSSLGGAVRIIPVAPNLDSFEAKAATSYSDTSGSGSDNTMVQGIVNIPIIKDKLAIRASAYRFDDSGFYQNIAGSDPTLQAAAVTYGAQAFATNQSHVGESIFSGGRITALFQATDDLKFTMTYLKQRTEVDGTVGVNRAGYDQALFQVPQQFAFGQTGNQTNIDLANAVGEYNLGWADLVATYSYTKSGTDFLFPWTLFSSWPIVTTEAGEHHERDGELRLATKLDGAWNFIVGGFWENFDDVESTPYFWYGSPSTSIYPLYPGQLIDNGGENRRLTQTAAFGDVSWRLLPKLTLTGGARLYHYDRANGSYDSGLSPGAPTSTLNSASATGSTFRSSLSYKPTEDALVYGTFSQGFRLGTADAGLPATLCDTNHDGLVDGTNISIASTTIVKSDSVNNYELGTKLTALDRRLSVSADVFRDDWSNIPAQLEQNCHGVLTGYTTNLGKAESDGVELQATSLVTDSIRLDVGASYVHARLTTDVPAQGLVAGDKLPAPEVNGNIGLQYATQIAGHRTTLRADTAYVGPFNSQIPATAQNKAGGYVTLNASARVQLHDFAVELFVHNLTNSDSVTYFYEVSQLLRPRTIGVQVDYAFGGNGR
jgi:iron complex outermembrane recepter protein